MVLKALSLLFFASLIGCATAGYERYEVFDEKRDEIYQHRAQFMDGGKVSMAYSIVYWDVIEGEEELKDRIPEVYNIWLRNNTPSSLTLDPLNLALLTEKGERIELSPLTDKTTSPLKKTELAGMATTTGYVVFEVPKEAIDKDKPSRLIYEDQAGNRVTRYIQIEDMKRHEGLTLEEPARYYAPVYPRNYWYPYYYPYAYYPFDLQLFFFYQFDARRRHYHFIPTQPEDRRFYKPSRPRKREFGGPSGSEKRREFQ